MDKRDCKVWASIWWCGDSDCDCHQPQIDVVGPHLAFNPRLIWPVVLWRGEYVCEPSREELTRLQTELMEECQARGIPCQLDEFNNPSGERPANGDEFRTWKQSMDAHLEYCKTLRTECVGKDSDD